MTYAGDTVMGEVSNTWLSVKFESRKHLRRKRFLIVIVLAILVPFMFYLVNTIGDADFINSGSTFAVHTLAFLNVLIIICAALFAGDAVSGEFEKKTGLLLFPTPQSRTSIFIGKYLAALLATFIVAALYCIVTTLEIIGMYGAGDIPAELARSYGLSALYAVSAVSVVYFCSSVLKRTMASTILGFITLFMLLPVLERILSLVDVEPWFIVSYSAKLIIQDLGEIAFEGPMRMRFALDDFTPDLETGIAVMAVYAVVFFAGSIIVANRKGME